MLRGGAGLEIAVASGFLLTGGTDAHHVALQEGLGSRQGRLVDAEGFQKFRKFVAGMRAAADKDIEFGG